MSEMQRNKGIVKRVSTKDNLKEVYERLIAEGKHDNKWDDLNEDGTPNWIDGDDYDIVDGCLFDISGAPDERDPSEGDVNEATKLNDTDYQVHALFYNGGASFSEMLEESIPKADKDYEEKKASKSGMTLFVVVKDGDFQRDPGFRRRHVRAYTSEKRAQNYAKLYGGKVVEFGEL